MTTETYDKQAEDEAFKAEMAGGIDAKAPEPEEPVLAKNATTEIEEVTEENQDVDEEVIERVEVIPGFTAEELQELKAQVAEIPHLQKGLATTNGTYGKKFQEQQKVIDDLRNAKTGSEEQAAKHAASLSDEEAAEFFEELREEFPEVSGSVAKGFSRAINKIMQGRSGGNSDDVQKLVHDGISSVMGEYKQQETERNIKRLTKRHPDWQDVAAYKTDTNGLVNWNNSAFGRWVQKQSQEVQTEIIHSDDPFDLIEYLDQYKSSLEVKQPEVKQVKTTQQVFGKAVQPKGAKGEKHLTDKELEDAAYREEMKKRLSF